MTIFGFKIGKKHIIIAGVVILLVIVVNTYSNNKKQKELEERRAEIQRQKELEKQQNQQNNANTQALSKAEIQQQEFVKEWGTPPEGFRWDKRGNLVATSSEDLTSEEVLYSYLKALAILDFSTVEKYSYTSMIDSTYLSYFKESGLGRTSYYNQFLRKEYKYALTTLEIDSVGDTAVFSNGTSIATVNLKVLDLTDKDFWQKDKEDIFTTLRSFYETEDDSAKAEQYIYDYIYQAYQDGTVGKRDVSVELKLDKVNLGGWLISDDTDLDMILRYDKGVNVADYIIECYNEWYKVKVKEEVKEEREKIREQQQKQREKLQQQQQQSNTSTSSPIKSN